MKEVRLNNGVMMPAIGFGVFQIPENETERVVSDALETGYRLIDTAAAYFNEEQVGDAIRHSGLKREELFVTTKLWVQDYEYDDALRSFDLSMKNSDWTISTSTCCTSLTAIITLHGVLRKSCTGKAASGLSV